MKKENDNKNTGKILIPLEKQLIFPMYLCSKEVIRIYSTLLRKVDLTYTQFVVMMYFWKRKTSNVKELGKIMLLDSSTLTPLLKKLEKKGLITRTKSTVDERNLVLELTKKGIDLKKEAMQIPPIIKEKCKLTESEQETSKTITLQIIK